MTGVTRRPESLGVRETWALASILMLGILNKLLHFAALCLSFVGRTK